ncbi:MAG: hypothetical protein QF532_05670 [Acidimicrobiales bacterium]|nr:hypothetical protein [Acidimicrobiales bacterium]
MSPTPTFPTDRLRVEPWEDPLVDRLGHDPRSTYAEHYWLGILGPSACWLLRRLADGLDADPTGFDLDLHDTAASIGLRLNGGRHAPFLRTLGRLCQFRMARQAGPSTLEVRRHLPPLTLSQADRLPAELRDRHRSFMEATRRDHEAESVRRARHLALTLVHLGEGLDATERQLREWRFEPTLCNEAAGWAWGSRRHPSNGHPSDQPLDESPEGRAPGFLPALDGAA